MRQQCELLGVNRSSLYYNPVEPDAETLALMRQIDVLHLKHPFFGSRVMTRTLKNKGHDINRKRTQRLMRLMGLESTAPKPNTSKPAPEHVVYPYLLRNVKVSRVDQVWATDITYSVPSSGLQRPDLSMSGIHLELGERRKLDPNDRSALWRGESRSGGDLLYTSRVTSPQETGHEAKPLRQDVPLG